MAQAAIREEAPNEALIEILLRLWQTKLKSISLLENWLTRTDDFDIKTGLKLQLADERRHLRVMGEELEHRGGRMAQTREQLLSRTFAIAQAQPNDACRLSAYFRGIKAFTFVRYGHLIPLVDAKLSRLLGQIADEEERHLRWAEIRLGRGMSLEESRQCRLAVERIEAALDGIWSKPWRRLVSMRRVYRR